MKSKWMAGLMLLAAPGLSERTASAEGCPCTGQDGNLGVNTTVALSCTISTTELAFGGYDPISAHATSPLDGTGGLSLSCTDNLNATVTLDQGTHPQDGSTDAAPLRQLSDGGTKRLSYFLYQDAARTTVWGNTHETAVCASGNIPVYGRISAGQNVSVGTYSDVVVVTVNL